MSYLSTNPTLMWKTGPGAEAGQEVDPDYMVVQAIGDHHLGARYFHVKDFEPGVLRMPNESESGEVGIVLDTIRENLRPVYLGRPILALRDQGIPEHVGRIWFCGPIQETLPLVGGVRVTKVVVCWSSRSEDEGDAYLIVPEYLWLSHELYLEGEELRARPTGFVPGPRHLAIDPGEAGVASLLNPRDLDRPRAPVAMDSLTGKRYEVRSPRQDDVPRWRFV